ncbi:LexA family protein [Zooshikella sp. RANM57]|uniref:LexA family protein n=1 Tax=Zooshikella sp. RANM57 TaxID=3425863 RepID=UPI003D6EE3D6
MIQQATTPRFDHSIAARFPLLKQHFVEERLNLHNYVVKHPEATFIIEAGDDYMHAHHIKTGDLLIVDRSLKPAHGDIVVASHHNQLLIRQLVVKELSAWLCTGGNTTADLAVKEDGIRILGVVTFSLSSKRG